jgi:uncharacterized protein YndB with AHSA1/START domain
MTDLPTDLPTDRPTDRHTHREIDRHTQLARASHEIAAAPEDVFDALVDPEALAEWFTPPDDGRSREWEVEPVPGGAWRARTVAPDGTEGELRGDIVTVDAPHLLELRWHRAAHDDAGSLVRFELEPIWRLGERATRLTVTHVADNPFAARVTMGGARALGAAPRFASFVTVPAQLLRSFVSYFASAAAGRR